MLASSFQEGSAASGDMLEIQVTDVEPCVLYAALRWVYTDRVDADMPAQQLLQVSSVLTSTTGKFCVFQLMMTLVHVFSFPTVICLERLYKVCPSRDEDVLADASS